MAQIQSEGWMAVVVNAGIAGFMLLWFTKTCEARLKGNEAATNRMTRAVLLLVVSLKTANDAAKQEARDILKEVDKADSSEGVTP